MGSPVPLRNDFNAALLRLLARRTQDAGQGRRFSRALQKLKVGDKIFAYVKQTGYVGYGEVTQPAMMIKEFVVDKENKPLLDLKLEAPKPNDNIDDHVRMAFR